MATFADQLGEFLFNPLVNALGLWIGTVIALAALVITYRSRAKTKSPCFAIESVPIVEQSISIFKSLKILYAGKQVENFSATKIAFWNAGRDTIMRKDIAPDDPLAVRVQKGCKILAADVIDKNVKNFFMKLTKDQSQARMSFDYLEKDQGAVLQVLHTGQTDTDIWVGGKVLQGKKLSGKNVTVPWEIHHPQLLGKLLTPRRIQNLSTLFMFLWPLGLMIAMDPFDVTADRALGYWVFVIMMFVIGWGIGFLSLRNRLPRGLDSYWKIWGEEEQEKKVKTKRLQEKRHQR